MSKEKTPIEELIEKLESSKAESTMALDGYEMAHNDGISEAMLIVESFLKAEREAIEEAYNDGWTDENPYDTTDSKQYYNDKYGR